MTRGKVLFAMSLIAALGVLLSCGPNKTEKLHDGVSFAKAALQTVGVNPFSTASYQSYLRNGKGPAAYVTALLPKENPPFDSFEDNRPSHSWTVVIRPSGAPHELSIEGYGLDIKKPLVVEYVTISLRSEE